MQVAFEYIFNLIVNDIYTPLVNAINSSNIFIHVIDFLNDFITWLMYLFKKEMVPTETIAFISNELLASIVGIIFLILSFILFYKIISFGFSTCKKIMNNMLVSTNENKGEWRKQWKRRNN